MYFVGAIRSWARRQGTPPRTIVTNPFDNILSFVAGFNDVNREKVRTIVPLVNCNTRNNDTYTNLRIVDDTSR